MERVNGQDWVDIGAGKRGFRSQNAGAGVPGTEVTAAFLNSLQEELAAIIEFKGGGLNEADRAQISKMLWWMRRKGDYVSANGTANAITVTLDPAPAGYVLGMTIDVEIAIANTGPVTIKVNDLGAKSVRPISSAALLTGGEFQPFMVVRLTYNGAVFVASNIAAADTVRGTVSLAQIKKTSGDAFKQASTVIDCTRRPLAPTPVNNVLTVITPVSLTDDGQADWQIVGSKIVCQKAGRFAFFASFGLNLISANFALAMNAGVYFNGAEFLNTSNRVQSASLNTTYGGGADVKDAVVGDYLEFRCFIDGMPAGAVVNYGARISVLRLAV